jgi:hypothetical protein
LAQKDVGRHRRHQPHEGQGDPRRHVRYKTPPKTVHETNFPLAWVPKQLGDSQCESMVRKRKDARACNSRHELSSRTGVATALTKPWARVDFRSRAQPFAAMLPHSGRLIASTTLTSSGQLGMLQAAGREARPARRAGHARRGFGGRSI